MKLYVSGNNFKFPSFLRFNNIFTNEKIHVSCTEMYICIMDILEHLHSTLNRNNVYGGKVRSYTVLGIARKFDSTINLDSVVIEDSTIV